MRQIWHSKIYIPIWLDLLSKIFNSRHFKLLNLHSNMVRFIIQFAREFVIARRNLHSNMVRFIIDYKSKHEFIVYGFTFQYG